MRVLFWGGTDGNNGPVNINKGIVNSLSECFCYSFAHGKYRKLLESVWYLLAADAVVISGVGKVNCILVGVAKALGKPSVYLMHGCAEQEYKQNGVQPNGRILNQERFLWKHSTRILPVSRRYMLWFQKQYPQFADKTGYIYNGIDNSLFECSPIAGEKKIGTVTACGGLRPLKGNSDVAEAVEVLNGKATFTIYGWPDEKLRDGICHSELKNKVPVDQFRKALAQSELFVLNSVLESFSTAVLEALACGCSVLISEVAGVVDLLALEETDIIHDPTNVDEIRGKIEYLLDHPNHDRLMSQFDVNEWTFGKMVERLEACCRELIQK